MLDSKGIRVRCRSHEFAHECLSRRGSRVRVPSTPPTCKQTRAFWARVSFRPPSRHPAVRGTLGAFSALRGAIL